MIAFNINHLKDWVTFKRFPLMVKSFNRGVKHEMGARKLQTQSKPAVTKKKTLRNSNSLMIINKEYVINIKI